MFAFSVMWKISESFRCLKRTNDGQRNKETKKRAIIHGQGNTLFSMKRKQVQQKGKEGPLPGFGKLYNY